MRKKALSLTALKILGAPSQSTKKTPNLIKAFSVLCSQTLPSTLQIKMLVQKNSIFRAGFPLWLFSFEQQQRKFHSAPSMQMFVSIAMYLPAYNRDLYFVHCAYLSKTVSALTAARNDFFIIQRSNNDAVSLVELLELT